MKTLTHYLAYIRYPVLVGVIIAIIIFALLGKENRH